MEWSKKKIIDTVESFQYDVCTKTTDEIEDKYDEFKQMFPKLYWTCLDPNFNLEELIGLLNIRDEASRNNTPDLVRDTTIGEHYAKKYVYPVVGEPTIEEKKIAARKAVLKSEQLKLDMKS
jgi:hypothetical protein